MFCCRFMSHLEFYCLSILLKRFTAIVTYLSDKVCNIKASKGSLFGQFHNNNIPGSKSGTKFPGLHQKREVPRDDLSNNTNRFSTCVIEKVPICWRICQVLNDIPSNKKGNFYYRTYKYKMLDKRICINLNVVKYNVVFGKSLSLT